MPTKYRFFNYPKRCPAKDYEDSINRIVKKYSGIRDLTALYEWGSVSTPGISDIDIICVFPNRKLSSLSFGKRSTYLSDSRTRYFTVHPFVFIDEKSLNDIKYINHNIDFKLLYGKRCNIKNLNPKQESQVKVALLNDMIIRHYPRDFISQLINKEINVRITLLRLHSIRHTIDILESLTKKRCVSWKSAMEEIQDLRDKWFERKNTGLLARLNEEAVYITMGIIETFRNFLLKSKLVEISSGNKVMFNGGKNRSLFIKDWDKDKALKSMIENQKNLYSVLPLELAPQLIEYSRYKGHISAHIRKNTESNITYKIKNRSIIKKRAKILNRQALLANRLRHSDFPAFFDFGYRNKSGINNWIVYILDKLRN